MIFLPPELTLAVAEAAALRFIDDSKCWVATLCLVCRAFKITVQPILYDTLILSCSNLAKVATTAEMTALFSHTHTLVALPSLIRELSQLLPSEAGTWSYRFPNVKEFTGWLPEVLDSDDWRLTTLSLAHGRAGTPRHDSTPAWAATLTHLHLSSNTHGCYFDLSQCAALKFIVWDFCSQPAYMEHVYDAMLPGMCADLIEGPPAVQRLLLRTLYLPAHVSSRVGEYIRAFATEQRVDRLWLDDSRVLLGGGEAQRFVDEVDPIDSDALDWLAVRDALRTRTSGSDWYLAGRQMYIGQDS